MRNAQTELDSMAVIYSRGHLKKKANSFKVKVFNAIIFVLFLDSMVPWFTFNVNKLVLEGIALLLIIPITAFNNMYDKSFNRAQVFLFLFFFLWLAKYNTFYGFINCFVHWGIVVIIIMLSDEYKYGLIRFITKWFGICLFISMIGYILHLAGVPLLHQYVEYGDYFFDNYYLFLQRELYRFQGPVIEPGHLTMGLAPILFLNNYNLKNKYVAVLFVAQLLTFSLAGYICLFVGYLIVSYNSHFRRFASSVLIIGVIFILTITVIQNNIREDLFQVLVLDRLEVVDDRLVGDDRSSLYLDQQFDKVVSSSEIVTGIYFNHELSEKGVAGFKLFFTQFGLIGILLLLLAYFSTLLNCYSHKRETFLFIMFLLMLLYQNAYPSWFFAVIPLLCGNAVIKYSHCYPQELTGKHQTKLDHRSS